ncbi:hypothetical protein LCGC14_1699720, partial [marine sediment metagenome]
SMGNLRGTSSGVYDEYLWADVTSKAGTDQKDHAHRGVQVTDWFKDVLVYR